MKMFLHEAQEAGGQLHKKAAKGASDMRREAAAALDKKQLLMCRACNTYLWYLHMCRACDTYVQNL